MDAKKLPINDSPIKYLMRFFVPLMIAFQKKDDVEGWFFSTHILTKVRKKTMKHWMIIQNFNPYILKIPCFLFSSVFLKEKHLMKVIKRLINKDWYIFLSVDFTFLKESQFYNTKNHFIHSVLLYGYDENTNTVCLCGYGFGNKINCVNVSFHDFVKAFYSCSHNQTWLYKRRKTSAKKFNKRFFYLGIKNYVNGTCSLEYQLKARSPSAIWRENYGVNAHEQIKADLNKILNGESEDLLGRFYSYSELADCMVMRLEYIQAKKILLNIQEIKEGFFELKKTYINMRNYFLKYNISKDKKIIELLIQMEDEAHEKEKKLYESLYFTTKKQFGYK